MEGTTLTVLAAGMGSRFGGLKQIEPFGINGETILDFSVYDAIKAGYDEVVFIIKKEIEHDFRELVGKRIEKKINVNYAFQELDKLPSAFKVPEGRVKPWGTGHAVLCAKEFLDKPFVIINADDYYGKEGFLALKKHLDTSDEYCMAAYKLENTLSEMGTVSRGVCQIEDGYLKSVREDTSIGKNNDYPDDTYVSMNMWGLKPDLFNYLENYFIEYLGEHIGEPKGEFYIPLVIDRAIKEDKNKIKVYKTNDKWYGVTYKEDKDGVKEALQKLQREGYYD